MPVGDDQRQHVEITRDIATRFNQRFGETFVLPEAVVPTVGARIMDLQDPTSKMSKSARLQTPVSSQLLDDPESIARKFKRAVTDSDGEVRYDPEHKPGVSNLLEILAALRDEKPENVAAGYTQYGPLKADAGEAVIEALRPIRERATELLADRGELAALLHKGADKARTVASATLDRAYEPSACSPPDPHLGKFSVISTSGEESCQGLTRSFPRSRNDTILPQMEGRGQMLSSAARRSAAAGP